ncbi:tetratricopeptide repeat-containing sensor histidine kinase [Flavobacterium sufflavum]|uniref:histidine kinase n=1 Tax=Flavobacterium sufflavum TaxID=1921138 RepID=A0A3S2UJX0_9FLAO|nr:tetratricopeptide repeat-containing sensor histidine kinase [Flavobacterium sufflavum]RVT71405.1 tetratricopeptide repeat-containing sensor histidine kinase [Flavobacterium sufflavum]
MILKKNLFPIHIILIIIFFTLQSCEKKKEAINNTNYNSKQVDKYFKLADKFYDDSKYDSAFYYANKTKLIINPEKELKKYTITMFILITSQQLQGDYSGAESAIVETLSFMNKSNNDKYKWKFYNMLAFNYMSQGNYDDALYYYKKTMSYNTNKRRKLLAIINIGYIYKEKKQFKKAIEILLPLLKEKEIKKNKNYSSGILNNLGYCYFKIGNPKAITFLNQSLQMNLNMDSTADDDYGLTANYFYLHDYYLKNDEKLAIKYADLLYQKASEYNNPDDRLIALSLLIKHSTGEKLKKYSLNYIRINDSITKVRQKAKNYFAKLKYDSKKEKEENLKLKAEKELQQELEKNKNIVIIFIIVIIIIVSGFIYYYLIEKSKKEKIQTAYNTEIRIAKKLHDELANDIYQTIAFAETQDLSTPNNAEKLLDNLDSIYATTRNISRENNLIETGSLFSSNLKDMISGFDTHSINLMINGLEEIDWTNIENFKKITIYRVLQELLVNMKKHSQCSLAIVSFKKQENNLLLNYFDNGIGINFDEKIKKNGLQNVENRIIAVNGTITFDNKINNGVKINMSIPI